MPCRLWNFWGQYMKSKKGKILKVIPGINPNCSSGIVVLLVLMYSVPIYLIINFVNSIILFKKRNNDFEKDIHIFNIVKSVNRLQYLAICGFILWIGSLLLFIFRLLSIDYAILILLSGLIISIPQSIILIISMNIGDKFLHSKYPLAILLISPGFYLIIIGIICVLFFKDIRILIDGLKSLLTALL
jgi:hypothetical protein